MVTDYTIDALGKAMVILRRVASASSATPLGELAASAGVSRSTAFRMLWNLERAGLVRPGVEGGYVLGTAAFDLGSAWQRQNPLARVARSYVDGLRDSTQETCSLIIRDQADRVCLYRAESRLEVRFTMGVGRIGPLWRGAAGRLLLAFMPAAERASLLAGHADQDTLEREAATLRELGFATSVQDTAPDLWSVAFPVHGADGAVLAALACTGPVQRHSKTNVARCRMLTQTAAATLSTTLRQGD